MRIKREQCKIGSKVRFWFPDNPYCRQIHNKVGIITQIGIFDMLVRFDGISSFNQELWCAMSYLQLVELTSEEQDRVNREEHADKYL